MSFNVIKALCVCGCVFGGMCDDVRGIDICQSMEQYDAASRKLVVHANDVAGLTEIGERFESIIALDEFLHMPAVELRRYKAFKFNGIVIDSVFVAHWYTFLPYEFDEVVFRRCDLTQGYAVVDHLNTKRLVVTECGIGSDDVIDIFRVDPYVVNYIDLTKNDLGDNERVFLETVRKYVDGRFCATINVTGNNLSRELLSKLSDMFICDD